MADPNYSWIYLIIFLAIPLARIIPRILSKYGIGKNTTNTIQEKQFQSGFDEYSQKPQMESSEPSMNTSKPQHQNRMPVIQAVLILKMVYVLKR